MKLKEFKKYMDKYEQKIETHNQQWVIMSSFVHINDMTLTSVREIRVIEGADNELLVWFDDNHIYLKDIKKFYILGVRSYLK